MAKTKKEFNKEAMYKKIMPSMFRTNDESHKSENKKNDNADESKENDIVNSSLSKLFEKAEKINSEENLENNNFKDVNYNSEAIEEIKIQEKNESQEEDSIDKVDDSEDNLSYSESKYTVNFIEVLIKDKLNTVLEKFKCCQCESCLADIVDTALSSFPKYSFTGTKKETEEAFKEFKQSNNIDVVSAIIKAIVLIRKKEKHKKN